MRPTVAVTFNNFNVRPLVSSDKCFLNQSGYIYDTFVGLVSVSFFWRENVLANEKTNKQDLRTF